MKYEALLELHKISNVPIPETMKILPEYWSTKKAGRSGAIRRNGLYGNPGTQEGRSRGGLATVRKFREDPEFAKELGFKLRTPMKMASFSVGLAEFIGIMLGDGFIKSNKTQLGIALNSETDHSYALFIQSLIEKLFNLNSSMLSNGKDKCITVLVSSRNLTEFMIDKGLKPGNKVLNQSDVPSWVNLKKQYKIACLRGLMDTDGSFYSYSHCVNGNTYKNYALDFTNHSLPLIHAVNNILNDIGCFPRFAKFKVVLNKKRDIKRYIDIVGTSNPSRKRKFKLFKY